MPDNQQELNLKNEILTRVEERHEAAEQERDEQLMDEQARAAQEEEENELERPSNASQRPTMESGRSGSSPQPQGYTSEQERWLEGLRAYQAYQAEQNKNVRDRKLYDKARHDLDKREKEREMADKKREEKRRKRNQQYDSRIERGGPGAIWAALKKFVMNVVVDNVVDLARGVKDLAVMGAGAAKDAIVDRIRSSAAKKEADADARLAEQTNMLNFMAQNGYLQPQQQMQPQQAQMQQQAQPQMQQQAQQQVQPEMQQQAQPQMQQQPQMQPEMQQENQPQRQGDQPQAEVQPEIQPQAMPRAAEGSRSFAEQRDMIGKNLNGLDNMCRSAALITGEQPSRRDLSVALACMHDPKVSGISEGQSRFESEKIMKFLSGEQLSPQDGPINQDLLKKGLDAARQPGAVEREGFLGAMHNLSRVISRAPSLDSPHRMAAGEALNEIAKECADSKNITRAVSFKDAKIEGNVSKNQTLRQLVEIRGAITYSNLYRQGKQAQYDELDRAAEMQQRGINPEAHRMSKDNLNAIVVAETINNELAQRMTRERIKLNEQQTIDRRADDIAKMPMPNPMTMKVSKTFAEVGKDPHMLDNLWEESLGKLHSVQEMQNGPAVRVLEDMEKNRGAIAERMLGDMRGIAETKQRQRDEEKRREREKANQPEKQNGKGISA